MRHMFGGKGKKAADGQEKDSKKEGRKSSYADATKSGTSSNSHNRYAALEDANIGRQMDPTQDPTYAWASSSTSHQEYSNAHDRLERSNVGRPFSSTTPHRSSRNKDFESGVSVTIESQPESQQERPRSPAPPQPPPIARSAAPENPVEYVLSGKELLLSYEGTSQYAQGGGVSACGLAAMNFSRIVLEKTKNGILGAQLLEDIISEKTIQEIISICPMWKGSAHLDVDEIRQLPIFDASLQCKDPSFSTATRKGFDKLITGLERSKEKYYASVMVITKAPEIIACLVFDIDGAYVFVIFDSHPRPLYPSGSGIIVCTNREKILDRLQELIGVDEELLNDPDLAWQMEMLFQFSGHNMVPRSDTVDLNELLLRMSVESYAKKDDYEERLKPIRKERDEAKKELEGARNMFGYRDQEHRARFANVESKYDVLHRRWKDDGTKMTKMVNDMKQTLKRAEDARDGLLQENQALRAQLLEYEKAAKQAKHPPSEELEYVESSQASNASQNVTAHPSDAVDMHSAPPPNHHHHHHQQQQQQQHSGTHHEGSAAADQSHAGETGPEPEADLAQIQTVQLVVVNRVTQAGSSTADRLPLASSFLPPHYAHGTSPRSTTTTTFSTVKPSAGEEDADDDEGFTMVDKEGAPKAEGDDMDVDEAMADSSGSVGEVRRQQQQQQLGADIAGDAGGGASPI